MSVTECNVLLMVHLLSTLKQLIRTNIDFMFCQMIDKLGCMIAQPRAVIDRACETWPLLCLMPAMGCLHVETKSV